ncbi:hypothetical protein L1O03_00260 [Corynebacterium uropygiale]|uniref:Uncharacterized protein n=1 Tax=Corynebacterium uropygiale TaxID=1775911 RepID=A0A9X1QP46_9CORY|nr:hypothetical protein [Corynebacterium uropygiale]MCF4005620.1 hypothetical protein [Corynebacterium uropygiale]
MRRPSLPRDPLGIAILVIALLCIIVPIILTLSAGVTVFRCAVVTVPIGIILSILCLWQKRSRGLLVASIVGGLAPILEVLLFMLFLQLAYVVTLGHWPPPTFG